MRLTWKHLSYLPLLAAALHHAPATAGGDDAAPSPVALEASRHAALESLAEQRQQYRTLFANAYARYPTLPRGSLEAIAYEQTGWRHVRPTDGLAKHERHMPAAWGVMGLYRGDGFADQVSEGARLIGVTPSLVASDPESNILAAAALLDRAFKQAARDPGVAGSRDAAYAAALQRYAGYGPGTGNIGSYARQSFAYGVLEALRTGVRAQGVSVPADARLNLRKAFPTDRLRLLEAPALTIDADNDAVSVLGGERPRQPATDAPRAVVAPATDAAANATLAADFGEAIWNPASSSNYSTAWNSTSAVIMHTMEGSYAGAISWFQNPSAQVSAHYLIRKSDGQITQMVREQHQAWHAAYHNNYTIGIEHDGYASDPGNWSSAMVNASARLTKSICARRGVNCASAWQGPGYDYWHVVPDSVRVKGHGMLTSNQNRYDPGKYFPWASFYSLINGGAPPPASSRYWVDTWANAPGYGSATSTSQTGTLYAGTNYVYCKTWGREVREGDSSNHWWLKTDLDVGPAGQWVSAYYLSRWGNDEARDNDGYDLPRCEVLPYGKIGQKWYAMGGVRSILGVPSLKEMDAGNGGRFQQFAKGIILWHSRTGAYAINGKILEHFWATGSEGKWGYALMDEMNAAKSPASGQAGRFQYFEKGLFLWTPATGAHVMHGAILNHFEDTGREAKYGYPKTDEQAYGSDGRKQVFEKGTFYWTPAKGVWVQ